MEPNRLIVFLKAPRPGTVKTRLAKTLGDRNALDAYEQLVRHLLENLADLDGVRLRYTPEDAGAEIARWLKAGWTSSPQGAGDLGARLTRALAEEFAAGARNVVIIGSDCPEVTTEDVRAAWAGLRDHEVVLGPARDGGYWLVALRGAQPELFTGIPWSTAEVLSRTLAKAGALGLRVKLLRELTDVDTEAEWREYQARQSRTSRD
jgi:hypothetical protein